MRNVLRYLRAANWDPETAAQMFAASVNLYRDFHPFVTAGLPSKLDHVWSKNIVNVLPSRDHDGRRILIFRLGRWNPSEFSAHDLYTATFSLLQMVSYESITQVAGTVFVFDIKDFGFKHLR